MDTEVAIVGDLALGARGKFEEGEEYDSKREAEDEKGELAVLKVAVTLEKGILSGTLCGKD